MDEVQRIPKNVHLHTNSNELLTITGAAVDGLGSSQLSSGNEYGLSSLHFGEHTNSVKRQPTDLAFMKSFSCNVHSSTSESDHDLNQTTKSQSSIASSSLLNGTATKVKISAKKLKQIKSPFDLVDVDIAESNRDNIANLQHSSNVGYKTAGVIVEKHHLNKERNAVPSVEQNLSDEQQPTNNGLIFSKGIVTTVTDSGYGTHNIQVIHEIQGEQFSQNTSNEEIQSLEEYSQEVYSNRIVEAVHHNGDSQNSSCTQPEIVTVQNSINFNASNGEPVSRDETVVCESQQSNENLQERFSRFQPALLKQGSLESGNSSLTSANKEDQLYIGQFNLNDKQKSLKQNFIKRQNQGPVKRHIQPKLLTTNPVTSKYQHTNKDVSYKHESGIGMQDHVTTAAVAAASAVAATQPFLKAQQDVESKMAHILEKLSANEAVKQVVQTPTDLLEDLTKQKVDDLQKQLNDLTQQRLDYLEKTQQQQVAFQAQLLSMSQGPSPVDITHQPQKKPVYIDPAIQRHRSATDLYEEIQKEKAVLATPAPRKRPPQPTSMFQDARTPPRKTTQGSFLAHILDSQEETPKHSPFPVTPTSPYSKSRRDQSPTVKRAAHLLHELSGLNNEIHYAVHNDDTEKVYTGPAPLDHYMGKPVDGPPSSPYPSHMEVSSGDVPVQDNYADAQATLREAKKTSNLLEANIDAILRARQESEVYATLDTLTYGSASERIRIRKMVDEHIRNMSSDMEREIMEELLRIEEKKKMTFMIPERDTSGTKAKTLYRGRGKGKAEPRIDTGLKKARTIADTRHIPLGKENKPVGMVRSRQPKKVKPVSSELEVKQLYGKTAHHGQRGTQRDPYLRMTTQPKSKLLPPPVKQTVRGIPMATAKTQTSSAAVAPQHYGPTMPQMPMAIPLGVPRRIGTIQVPPGSIPAPSTTHTVAPSPIGIPRPPATSTPITGLGGNVGMVEIKGETFDEEDEVHYKPQLTKQVLPSVNIQNDKKQPQLTKTDMPKVDIDTERSLAIKTPRDGSPTLKSARSQKGSPRSRSPLQKFVKDAADQLQEVIDEAQFLQESFEESSEEEPGIELPGYTRPQSREQYGPQFPPQTAPKTEFEPSSDVIAADIRRKDMLANKAVHWVEQELMARIITEAYSNRGQPLQRPTLPETVPHTTPVPKRSRVHEYEDDVDTVSTLSEHASQHDSLIAEALGQDGMKLFVDAGQPVDENLVHALIKEVLLENYQNSVGQRTSKDDEHMRHTATVKSPRKTTTSKPSTGITTHVTTVKRVASPPMQIPDTPVMTPEPTPKGSPRASSPPNYRVSTPPETPDVTPEPSVAEEYVRPKELVRVKEVYSEEEEEIRMPIPQLQDKRVADQDEDFVSRHDVQTPEHTPPPSPTNVSARTPSPSVAEEYTPIPSEAEEEKQPTPPVTPPLVVEKEIVIHRVPQAAPEIPKEMPEPIELNERGQQTSPTPPPSEPTEEEEEETETSSWNTAVSETVGEPLSEGQWIVSMQSEGEVIPRINLDMRNRVRDKMATGNLRLSQEDTLNEAADFDQDTLNATQSEGEVLHAAHGVENDPYLKLLSEVTPDPKFMFRGSNKTHKMNRDMSIGEINIGPDMNGFNGAARSETRVQSNGGRNLVSPGEFLHGDGPILQPKKWDEQQATENVVQVREIHSPPPAIRTITVRPSTPEETVQRPTAQPPISASPVKSQAKSYKPGGPGRGLSSGLRPQISAGGRPPSPDKRGHRREEIRRSQEVLYGTTSELESRTMTPDQMNVDVLLASQDYLADTQSELMSTDEVGTGGMPWQKTKEWKESPRIRSGEQGRKSQEFGRSQEMARKSQEINQQTGEFGERQSLEFAGDSGEYVPIRTGRFIDTFGSTSDMSLPEGMTQTLEREDSDKMTHTIDSESDLKLSGKYPDSLEGTGGKGTGESVKREHYIKHVTSSSYSKTVDERRGPMQLSLTIPSVGEEDEDPSESYDVSELSLT